MQFEISLVSVWRHAHPYDVGDIMFGVLDFFGGFSPTSVISMASEMVVVELPHIRIIQRSSVAISYSKW